MQKIAVPIKIERRILLFGRGDLSVEDCSEFVGSICISLSQTTAFVN
jgi:hypothetical protein